LKMVEGEKSVTWEEFVDHVNGVLKKHGKTGDIRVKSVEIIDLDDIKKLHVYNTSQYVSIFN